MSAEEGEDFDAELAAFSDQLMNPELWAEIVRCKRTEPGLFVSGWEEDNEDVEEDSDEMETDDEEKMMLKAAEHGDLARVQDLINTNPQVVHARDTDEYTPLHRASYNNHPEIIRCLVTAGADPMARTENGWTPLHCASCWGCLQAAETLISTQRVDVNARTHGQLTPLHLAAACNEDPQGAAAIVRLLLARPECNPRLKSSAGETPGEIARRTSRTMAVAFDLLTAAEAKADSSENNPSISADSRNGQIKVTADAEMAEGCSAEVTDTEATNGSA